jgi:ABC-type Fe3+ transport system permease subunit
MERWPQCIALLLLFGFAYGDFTVNSLLAPPQFTSASVRLLNLLHYGRNSALNVMFAFAFAVPLGAALLTALAARIYARRCVR